MNAMFVTKDLQEQTLWSDIKEHTQRVTYSCKSFVCNERFTQASNLARHKRRHTGEKPYECNVCNKRFTRANNMVRHKKTHTGEKPYECDVYDNKFPSYSNLLKHRAKDDKKNKYFDLKIEPKSRKPMGIACMCCVCDKELEIACELEKHMAGHIRMYFYFERKDSVT